MAPCRLADGLHKASNIPDSPSVQLVVSLGKKTASVLKNEALPEDGQHTVANGSAPSDSIAPIDGQRSMPQQIRHTALGGDLAEDLHPRRFGCIRGSFRLFFDELGIGHGSYGEDSSVVI